MRKLIRSVVIVCCFLSYRLCIAQSSSKYIEIEWKNGSEAAKKIMVNKFYYDPLDSWSPFGNDTGSDAYYLYSDWKKQHPNENIRNFINEELVGLGYPGFDLSMDDHDPEKLKGIVDKMMNKYIDLNAIDNEIIAIAFTQLFLEGRIEPEVKKWAEAAFRRESVFLDYWDGEKGEKEEREKRMNQLLEDLRKSKP